jgi:hypothetical protein
MGVLYRLADWSFTLLHTLMQHLNDSILQT